MGLFQRNPYQSTELQQHYTLGLNKTVLIVGLGNQGKQYEKTRHNLGFICLDAFASSQEFDSWLEKKDLKSLLSIKTLGDTRVILSKPTTMMNLSGEAVQKISNFYKIASKNILVVHDELDIPFGQIRARVGGSSSHNGIKSLEQHLDSEFTRLRIGIYGPGKDQIDGADYVLANLSEEEQSQLSNLTREASAMIGEFIAAGKLEAETRSFLI